MTNVKQTKGFSLEKFNRPVDTTVEVEISDISYTGADKGRAEIVHKETRFDVGE